ncbi:uncharacterized protein V1518DRAFT_416141 [Limtongia smithiae]|uniref:uncharacterized protein n=1 Tax=Limtongia smithiae TaxID=1125753 RepID=UPI0034CFE619
MAELSEPTPSPSPSPSLSSSSTASSSKESLSTPPVSSPPCRKIKVAVIGTGLAGLATAYYLTQASDNDINYDVHLFDERPTIGFDSQSVTATDRDGVSRRVDVPMRSFAGGYYTRVIALYKSLGLKFRDARFTYSFSELDRDEVHGTSKTTTYYMHGGRRGVFKHGGRPADLGLARYLVQLTAITFWYIYFTLITTFSRPKGGLSFKNEQKPDPASRYWYITTPADREVRENEIRTEASGYGSMTADEEEIDISVGVESLKEYLVRWHVAKWFIDRFVTPLFCAMSTCNTSTILRAPAADVVDYKKETFLKPHFLLEDNSRSAIAALTADLPEENIHLGHAVQGLLSEGTTWTVRTENHPDLYHVTHVVFAVAPSRIGQLYAPLEPVLKDIKSSRVRVLVHTDDRVLDFLDPRNVRDLNLVRAGDATETTHMLFPGIYQTTSPMAFNRSPSPTGAYTNEKTDFGGRISPESVLSESVFERVVRTHGLVQAVEKMRKRQGRHNIWVAGSWMWQGLVLLEGCVTSAQVVTEGIERRSKNPRARRYMV